MSIVMSQLELASVRFVSLLSILVAAKQLPDTVIGFTVNRSSKEVIVL